MVHILVPGVEARRPIRSIAPTARGTVRRSVRTTARLLGSGGMPSRTTWCALALFSMVLAACGATSTGAEHPGSADRPPPVTDESYQEVMRTYLRMDPDDAARIAWRDALIHHLAARSGEILTEGDYDTVVAHLASLVTLMSPADVGEGHVPEELAPLARWVVEHGSPRGDEGRVMGAHLLLAAIGEDVDAHRGERDEIARWGRDARSRIDNPIERFGELIQVWEQQEQLAPSPEVLRVLARLYIEQREALREAFGPESQGNETPGRLSFHQLRLAPLLIQRAPLDVAAVFLRHGWIEAAVESVRRIEPVQGDDGQVLERLVEILQAARDDNARGMEALNELAQGFSQARPEITAAICRVGVRRFPADARFPLCLARVAIEANHASEATAWYAEAIRLAPDERPVYSEALRQLDEMMEEGIFDANVSQSRSIAHSALQILDEHEARWPNAEAAVTRNEILLQIGRAEMSAGNVQEARRRLEQSLAANGGRLAHIQLGMLLERLGRGDEAAVHYREALDQTSSRGAEGLVERAQLVERLGDAFRVAGSEPQARRMYRQALSHWDELLAEMLGPRRAIGQVRRGVLLSRLGDEPASAEAFGAAMEAAPSWREPYATILAHLVVSEPNVRLAQTVLRRAQSQLRLEPEWKVYFALWVQAIAARASIQPEREVTDLLDQMSRGETWANRLAAYGRHTIEYTQLVEHAQNRAQRVEANFYEGARLLGAGDVAGARHLFELVTGSGMINFFEYQMAQEFLQETVPPGGGVAETRAP